VWRTTPSSRPASVSARELRQSSRSTIDDRRLDPNPPVGGQLSRGLRDSDLAARRCLQGQRTAWREAASGPGRPARPQGGRGAVFSTARRRPAPAGPRTDGQNNPQSEELELGRALVQLPEARRRHKSRPSETMISRPRGRVQTRSRKTSARKSIARGHREHLNTQRVRDSRQASLAQGPMPPPEDHPFTSQPATARHRKSAD